MTVSMRTDFTGCAAECWDPSVTWVERGRAAPAKQWAAAWTGNEAADHCSTPFRGIDPTSMGPTTCGAPDFATQVDYAEPSSHAGTEQQYLIRGVVP
jgi:hypothetical protein